MDTPLHLIYIAGPMRGVPGWNYDAFDAAEVRLRAAGWWPINPARTSRALGYRPDSDVPSSNCDVYLRHVMAVDVASIMQCQAIALLPGWEHSLGSTVELALAQFLLLPVYCAVTMKVINPGDCPWRYTWTSPSYETEDGWRLASRSVGKVTCWQCNGTGFHLGAAPDRCNPPCMLCSGTGRVHHPIATGGTL